MSDRPTRLRDLRKYARQTSVQLIAGALLLLFLVGDGLIAYIYGPGAAVMGVLCLLGGLAPVLVIILVLWLMEWVVKRANRE
jgi:hypothetical protein